MDQKELLHKLKRREKAIEELIKIGHSLSANTNFNEVIEGILLGAKNLSFADGGTLYLMNEEDQLNFTVVQTDSLNIKMGGTQGEITWPPLSLTK